MSLRSDKHRAPASSDAAVVALITAIAVVARVALASGSGLWRDEALFVAVATSPSIGSMFDFLKFNESHPPLFYLIMRGWFSVVGNSDRAAVIVPIVFGVILIPLIYFVGRSLFSRRIGLIAAAFAAIAPALSEYSAQVRPYSLLPNLALLSIYFFVRGVDSGGVRRWGWYLLSTVALIYTHNWGWLVVIGEWAAMAVILFRGRGINRKAISRDWLVTQGLLLAAFLLWLPTLLHQVRFAGHGPSALNLISDPVTVIAFGVHELVAAAWIPSAPFNAPPNFPFPSRILIALPAALLAVDQFLRARQAGKKTTQQQTDAAREQSSNTWLALIGVLGIPMFAWLAALILSAYSDLIYVSCLVMLAPALLLALAWWLEQPRSGARLWLARSAAVAFVLTYSWTVYKVAGTSRSNAREIAAAVKAQTQPSDLLIIVPEWLASSFNRYYTEPVEQIDYPRFGREERISFSRIMDRLADSASLERVQSRIRSAQLERRRVWLVVLSSSLHETSERVINRLLNAPNRTGLEGARIAQLRAGLERSYHLSGLVGTTRPSRYEEMCALLYTPFDGSAVSGELDRAVRIRSCGPIKR